MIYEPKLRSIAVTSFREAVSEGLLRKLSELPLDRDYILLDDTLRERLGSMILSSTEFGRFVPVRQDETP